MSYIIKLRRGPAAEWTTDNPVLRQGEPGFELFTGKFKIGDGIQHWNDLPYFIAEDDVLELITETIESLTVAGVTINDLSTTSTTETYSVAKIKALNDAQDIIVGGKAATVHTHTLSQITDATSKADDSVVVKLSGSQTVNGVKTFSSAPVVPDDSFSIAKTLGLQVELDAKAVIVDGSATNATTTTYSANKINLAISTAVAALIGTAPSVLDTLGEISDALNDDANAVATLTTLIAGKQALDSDLTTIAGLTATSDSFMQAKSGAWAARTVAQVKTDLGLTGTNSGDQTTIVGIAGTKAQFNTAVTDGDFLFVGDAVGVTDGDKGDLTVSSTGTVWTIDNDVVTYAKMQDVSATSRLLGRITAGAGNVEELSNSQIRTIINLQPDLDAKQNLDSDLTTIAGLTATTDSFMQAKGSAWAARTIAQVKTDLGLTGTNSGDQTSIVGLSGTKAQFDTAVSDGNIVYVGDTIDTPTFSGLVTIGSGDLQNMYTTSMGTPQKVDVRQGTSASPVTTLGPTVKVSRRERLTRAAVEAASSTGADGVDVCSALAGLNYADAASEVQAVGVFGGATSATTVTGIPGNDACGLYGVGKMLDGANGTAIGAFVGARREGNTGRSNGLEVHTRNGGSQTDLTATQFPFSQGIWINCSGNADSAAAININNAFGRQFQVGLAFGAMVNNSKTGGVRESSIRDESASERSLHIKGSHSKGALVIADGSGEVAIGHEPTTPSGLMDIRNTTVGRVIVYGRRANGQTVDIIRFATHDDTGTLFSIGSSGHIRPGAGTTSFPSFAHNSDANTGLNLATADVLSLVTGGTARLAINTSGIQLFNGETFALGGGAGVIGITDATTVPTTNPSGGGILYSQSGLPKWRTSAGTVIDLSAAGSGAVTDGDKGDITASASGTTWTIDNDVVTYAKMQNVSATSRVLGRITSGAGDPEELTGSDVRTITGLATSDSPQFTGIEVGNASDTTLTRSAAGVLAVEGVVIPSVSSTSTLTNKTLTAPVISAPTMSGLVTIGSGDSNNFYTTTAGAPQVVDVRQGTSGSPLTSLGPTVKISRTEQFTRAAVEAASATGSDGVDMCSAVVGINVGTTSTEVQAVGVFGSAKTTSTYAGNNADACGLYGAGKVTGSGTGAGIGAFLMGRRETATGRAVGLEVAAGNYAAADTYNPANTNSTKGIWLTAPGDNNSAVGILIGKPGAGWKQFDVGLAFSSQNSGAIVSQSVRDDSTSATSLQINGTHATAAIAIADASGKVGIGTLAPTYRLDVSDPTSSPPGTVIAARSTAVTTKVLIENSATDGDPILQWSLPSVRNWMMGIDDGDSDRLKVQPASTADWSASVWVFETSGVQLGPTVSHGGGVGVIGIADATTVPTTNPSGGAILYSEGGVPKWRTSGGTVIDLSAMQPLDSDLTTIAGLTATTDNFMQSKSGAWASRTIAQVKTDLGLTGTNSGDQTSIVGITGTKAQFNTAVSDGDIFFTDDATLVSKTYLSSRGNGLVTNGNGLLGDNTNFPGTTFDDDDRPVGAIGVFKSSTASHIITGAENISVNPALGYRTLISVKQISGSGQWFFGLSPYDADGLAISPYHYMEQASTRTTLAADLVNGATTVSLTSSTNWNNAAGASTWLRNIIFWNYTDGKGKLWAAGTYSRTVLQNAYADGGISGNTITLSAPYSGPTIPSGTAVGNGSSGAGFIYMHNNVAGPSVWTDYFGTIKPGYHADITAPATDKFPQATAYVKTIILANYPTASSSVQSFGNVGMYPLIGVYSDSSGHVGIGTVSPVTQLDILGEGAVGNIRVKIHASQTSAHPAIEVRATNDSPLAQFMAAGHIRSAAGSGASFPSFAHVSDTDTGFTLTGSNGAGIATGGAYRQQWSDNGSQFGTAFSLGGGVGVIGIADATTVPTTNPSGGGILYSQSGAIKWRNSSGTVTDLTAGGAGVSDGDKGDITVSASGATWTVDNSAITLAKIANIATSRVLGRITASSGVVEELTGSDIRTIAGLATGDSPQFTGIELGHASDTTIARVSAGVISVEGKNVALNGTGEAHTVGTIELGHASDTTLSRSSAGALAVEGVLVSTASNTLTLTNKTLTSPVINTPTGIVKGDVGLGNVDNTSNATERAATATLTNKRITSRTGTTTSSATPTINTDNVDFYSITALTTAITSMTTNLSGTPTEDQKLRIAITGTAARAITWGASFEASTVALPTTTVGTARLDIGFVWNAVTSKWRCVAVA